MPRGAFVVAGLLTVALAAAGGGYGFHRDELYLIEAGQHPAWGYPDQPAVAPLLAAGLHRIVGGSLWGFRLLPAVLAGLLVLVAAATSAQLGGTRRDRVITATVTALSTTVLVVGHLFSTTTFDILLTATTVWLLLRALDSPPEHSVRRWLLVGLSAGLALQFKALIASVLLACAVALLLAGPRAPLRGRGPWLAAALAAAMAVPNLLWQAANGWPQLELSRAIAAGSSGTSVERWLILPLQFTLTGPRHRGSAGRRCRRPAAGSRPADAALDRRGVPPAARPVHRHRRQAVLHRGAAAGAAGRRRARDVAVGRRVGRAPAAGRAAPGRPCGDLCGHRVARGARDRAARHTIARREL
jgi:hypothetical protein